MGGYYNYYNLLLPTVVGVVIFFYFFCLECRARSEHKATSLNVLVVCTRRVSERVYATYSLTQVLNSKVERFTRQGYHSLICHRLVRREGPSKAKLFLYISNTT